MIYSCRAARSGVAAMITSLGKEKGARTSVFILFGILPAAILWIATAQARTIDYSKAFDWDQVFPLLEDAAPLSPKEGVTAIFQGFAPLRTAIAIQLQKTCTLQDSSPICRSRLGDTILEERITAEIDDVLQSATRSQGSLTSVEYDLSRAGPFPWTRMIAMRSHNAVHALLVLYPDATTSQRGPLFLKLGPPHQELRDANDNSQLIYRYKVGRYQREIKVILAAAGLRVLQVWITVTQQ
jgi:hypothetical protein